MTLGHELADELEPVEQPEALCARLKDAQGQIFELSKSLADAREEPEAVSEINRELLAVHNRPGR